MGDEGFGGGGISGDSAGFSERAALGAASGERIDPRGNRPDFPDSDIPSRTAAALGRIGRAVSSMRKGGRR